MGRVLLAGLSDAELDAWFEDLEPVRHTRHTVVEPRKLRRLIAAVRAQGYAVVEQELELGLCSLAVPLRNREGRVAAALNIGMQYQPDAPARALRELLPALRETAAAIERDTPSTWLPAVRP
jgi:IclR family pca regulon transcriptional regulator